MAETTTIARPYAEAVFQLADKSGKLAEWHKLLRTMAAVAADGRVREAIANPSLNPEQVYGLFASLVGGGGLPADAQNFLRVLIQNDRLALLPEVHGRFEELKNEREGVLEAEVRSAFPLDDGQRQGLVADLERRFKRKIRPQVVVDRELIGGVRITVGDEVIDGSVRGKLEDMATILKS